MPRIRQKAEVYAEEDFRKEIRRQQGEYDLMSVRSLAAAADIKSTTLHERLKEPKKFTVADLQKLVSTIRLSPVAVLTLLGYSAKDIKNLVNTQVVVGSDSGC